MAEDSFQVFVNGIQGKTTTYDVKKDDLYVSNDIYKVTLHLS